MYSRKIALSLAKQYRRCPPADILKDPSRTAALEKHRRICPYCAADKEKDPPDWDLLVERIQHLRVSTKMDSTDNETPVKAGQLRMVKSPGIWREGWFYNPPMVLVVREALNTPGAVMVAQVYHDPRLAAPGDLILSEGDTAVAPPFVESWNDYSLEASFLGPLLDVVSHQILDAVPGCGEKPDQSPDWAPLPLPMVENDPRAFFR